LARVVCVVLLVLTAGCKSRDSETRGQPVNVVDIRQLKDLISVQTNALIFLHFWSTYCPPCLDEFPSMIKLADKWDGHGVTVLLVAADSRRNIAAVNDYLAKHQVQHTCYLADNLNDAFITGVSQQWSGALPASFFIAADGTIAEWWEGPRPYDAYDAAMQELLNGKKKGSGKP